MSDKCVHCQRCKGGCRDVCKCCGVCQDCGRHNAELSPVIPYVPMTPSAPQVYPQWQISHGDLLKPYGGVQ